MASVLVTGGTGHLGRDIVDRLVRDGHRVRVFARSPHARSDVEWAAGDLATGAGLQDALRGVDTVINAATFSPIARRGGIRPVDFFRSPSAVDVEGTARLLSSSSDASVHHFLHVSIVGLDEATLPYARIKLAGEKLVQSSSLSWSVVRAMPFYYLLDKLLSGLAWLPVWPMPQVAVQSGRHVRRRRPCGRMCLRRAARRASGDWWSRGPQPCGAGCTIPGRLCSAAQDTADEALPARARGMGFVVSHGVRGRLTWADWLGSASSTCRPA